MIHPNPQKALRQQREAAWSKGPPSLVATRSRQLGLKDPPHELLRRNLITNRKDQVSIRVKPNVPFTNRIQVPILWSVSS